VPTAQQLWCCWLGAGREQAVLTRLGHAAERTAGDGNSYAGPLEAMKCSERGKEMWEIDAERRDREIFTRGENGTRWDDAGCM
jgi:hypothetical protein